MNESRWMTPLLLWTLGLLWGSSFILMKLALFDRDGGVLFEPLQLAALRMAIAGTVLMPVAVRFLLRVRTKTADGKPTRWGSLAVVALIGSLGPAILFATAQTGLPSALAGMLNALSPLWTLVIALVVFKVHVKPGQFAGLLIGFAGAAWLIAGQGLGTGDGAMDGLTFTSAIPAILIVLATMGYGLAINVTRERLIGIPGYAIAALTLGMIALPCWGYVIYSGLPQLVITHPDGMRGLLAIAVLALAGTALALTLFNRLIALTSAVVAASVTYIIPLFAAFWGWLDGEALTWTHLLSGAVILIGVWATRKGG